MKFFRAYFSYNIFRQPIIYSYQFQSASSFDLEKVAIPGVNDPETINKILTLSKAKARQPITGNPERPLKVRQPARQKAKGLAYLLTGRKVLPPKRVIGKIRIGLQTPNSAIIQKFKIKRNSNSLDTLTCTRVT